MTFFKNIEEQVGNVSDLGYQHLEFYFGKELELFRPDKSDIFTKVHNKDANVAPTKLKNFIGITQADELFVTDSFNKARFKEGFLITQDTDIRAGDIIVFEGEGGFQKYKVEKQLEIGYTTKMFVKFSLSNMN